LSLALAETTTVPDTVAPATGAVTETLGRVPSDGSGLFGVVTDKGADGAEALPAASTAETVKDYSTLAKSPVIEADVPLGEATSVPSRYTR